MNKNIQDKTLEWYRHLLRGASMGHDPTVAISLRADRDKWCDIILAHNDKLMHDARHAPMHFNLLNDRLLTATLPFFKSIEDYTSDGNLISEHHVQKARNLLSRLPSIPPKNELSQMVWHGKYLAGIEKFCLKDGRSTLEDTHRFETSPWEELEVVNTMSSLTAFVGLLVASSNEGRFDLGASIASTLNMISELTGDIAERGKNNSDDGYLLERTIVQAFLWSTWTQCLQLFFWFILRHHLDQGHDEDWDRLLALSGISSLMNPSIGATLYGWNNFRVPYMCSWAFNLLKEDRGSLGLDFRTFHERYAELHGEKKGRCIWDLEEACDGGHPLGCGRFQDKRLVAAEQSVHDCQMNDCERLKWSRESYVSISGPVAISASMATGRVNYIQATERTMAISHVWSHGHGGRPDTGMNSCLHARFSRIAKLNGCDSYWIDSLCIPDEHELRREAIGYINQIFAQGQVVLVLDRDLMDIDISDLSTELIECLLATFIVCDWNVRAWTMLEAMKGCHNLHLLCKDNRTVSLRFCLQEVHKSGSIDIAVLFLAARHLLPTSTDPYRRSTSRKTIEGAASLLSHRHATREGDDVVIWSLISGIRVYFKAEDLWRGRIGQTVKTAFLMSSAPRLTEVPGFSWAPQTPYIRRPAQVSLADVLGPYTGFEGEGSEEARITARGLVGLWAVYHLTLEDARLYQEAPVTAVFQTSDGKRETKTFTGHKIINRCWRSAAAYLESYQNVVLLRPLQHGGTQTSRSNSDRGESHGEVFAICVSQGGEKWIWKMVTAWPQALPTPPMVIDELILV